MNIRKPLFSDHFRKGKLPVGTGDQRIPNIKVPIINSRKREYEPGASQKEPSGQGVYEAFYPGTGGNQCFLIHCKMNANITGIIKLLSRNT